MKISEHISNTIESWSERWKDRLRGWMASWVEGGITRVMDFMEPDLRAEIKPSLLRLREIPGMPADFTALIDKTLVEPKAIHLVAILPYLVGIMVGLGMGAAGPVARMGSYQVDKLIHSARFDPTSVITAWRRDPKKYAHLFDDLKDQGWGDKSIEALKFFTQFIPSADEQTLWLAREVYEPEMVEKYGLDEELPVYDNTDFSKVGVSPEQMINKWRAHWEHASWMQMVEMLHRGLVTEADVWEWFRLVEITPFWRDSLIKSAYTWPTRVDVRRWWDMRTIDEPELRRLYSGMGYRGVNLDNYILWTKVYVAFPDLIARWQNGWISIEDVKRELTGLGMPSDRVEEMIQTKIKPTQAARTTKEKDLTKAEIVKGVKKGVISEAEGAELLQDMGYDADEADYILTINIAAAAGSPETYEEFKDITQKYRRAAGMEAKEVSEELKKAAAKVVDITKEVESLKAAVAEEQATIVDEETAAPGVTAKLKKLRVSLHRAEAKLAEAQSDYNALLAQWRHGG